MQIAAGSRAATDFEKGRDIYNFRCYFCHGYAGDAKTLAATYLQPLPRNFTETPLNKLPRARMIRSVTDGRMNTGMAGFKDILSPKEIELVVDFIRQAFMGSDKLNTRYHTEGNGWPNHERYAAAFPFAKGEIAIDTPVAKLNAEQRRGRELFMASCITCHDRAKVEDEGIPWDPRPVSYPRTSYSHTLPVTDAVSSATPYSIHNKVPKVNGLTKQEREGEAIYQAPNSCAFCHAADGTGKNWIGMFLEPHARDLTQLHGMTQQRLEKVIRDGLEGTTMPAWRDVLNEKQRAAVAAYVMRAFAPKVDALQRKPE